MLNNRVTFLSRFLLPPESARAVPGSVQVWARGVCKLELEWCDLFTLQRYDILQWRCPIMTHYWTKCPKMPHYSSSSVTP